MKKYKIWLNIEEIDEEAGEYTDLTEHLCSLGPDLATVEDALALIEEVANYLVDLEDVIFGGKNSGKIEKYSEGKDGISLED